MNSHINNTWWKYHHNEQHEQYLLSYQHEQLDRKKLTNITCEKKKRERERERDYTKLTFSLFNCSRLMLAMLRDLAEKWDENDMWIAI